MAYFKIVEDVYFVGAIHWDRRLFDELIPLPDGTSYNAYLVIGKEKVALIDTVDPTTINELMYNLKQLNVKKIDYIISNHAEQDHSGAIPLILQEYTNSKVVTNKKCKSMLKDLLLIPDEKFIEVNEGDKLDLGSKTLVFYNIPWVHWPETMATYLIEDKIVFTCDMFGSHIATSDIFDTKDFYLPAKRYYAEIMSPFRVNVRNNIEKIKKLDVEIIAPSHGYIFKNKDLIISAYEEWSSENVKNEVIIAYVSMHGSTLKIVEHLKEELIKRNLKVHYFNLTVTDLGAITMTLLDAATLIIGAPIVLTGIHPLAAYVCYLFNLLRPKTKFLTFVSSYGWQLNISQHLLQHISSLIPNLKAELIQPLLINGFPKNDDFEKINKLAEEIYLKHKSIGLTS